MRLPHKVTVWNRSDDEKYTRIVIDGVLWEDNRGAQLRKTGISSDNGIFVLIPFASTPEDFCVRAQDWMAQGDIAVDPKSSKELVAAGATLISAIDKLDCGGLPHWEVTGK